MTIGIPGCPRRRPYIGLRVGALSAALVVLTSCSTPVGSDSTLGVDSSVTAGAVEASPTVEKPDEGVVESPISSLPSGPPSSSAESSPPVSVSTEPSDDKAAEIADAVDRALQTLADGKDAGTRDQVRDAIEQGFASAGSTPEMVEVSIDRTPTGLDVDAIQGAGLIGEHCIFGELREKTVSTVVLPVLASGRCFIGDQR